jgi:hypothetical protein
MGTSELTVRRRRWGYVVTAAFVLVSVWIVVNLAGMFQLSSDTAALRDTVMREIDGSCEKKIALRAGFLTTGLIRLGAKALKLDAEPRAVIESVRGAEVGIYSLKDEAGTADCGRILNGADQVMSARGWERVAGISKEGKLVAIFSPRAASARTLKLCLVVLDGQKLVVAAGKGDLAPVLDLAMARMNAEGRREARLAEKRVPSANYAN